MVYLVEILVYLEELLMVYHGGNIGFTGEHINCLPGRNTVLPGGNFIGLPGRNILVYLVDLLLVYLVKILVLLVEV